MKKLIFAILLFLSAILVANAKTEVVIVPLWADSMTTNQTEQPSLHIYPAKKPCGTAIIMCPGGAYRRLSINEKGISSIAQWMNTLGITYAVLHYSMPHGNHSLPLADAEQAMHIMRSRAKEWGVNPSSIGIMGASAGGHLASTLATHYSSADTRPDFQILLYPTISMTEGVAFGGGRINLLGENPSKELEEKYSNELWVTSQTPKAFIASSTNDNVVLVGNSLRYYSALVKNGVSAAMHLYPTGKHGWIYKDSFIYKRDWTGELEKWLLTEVLSPN